MSEEWKRLCCPAPVTEQKVVAVAAQISWLQATADGISGGPVARAAWLEEVCRKKGCWLPTVDMKTEEKSDLVVTTDWEIAKREELDREAAAIAGGVKAA